MSAKKLQENPEQPRRGAASPSKNTQSFSLIVHCHLAWDGVWQRPQQFLSRLSLNHPVLFVEGPILVEGDQPPACRLDPVPDYSKVTVMKTFFPRARFHDGRWVDAERHRLLRETLAGPLQGQFQNIVQWFYDPMAVTAFAGRLGESAIVYDCMDQLSQFKFAPPALVQREKELLQKADLVFTGGRKLYEAKSQLNSNCHFYGCGVDVEHFGRARASSTVIPADVASLKGPVLGFFGVVDERMDYELIELLAEKHPEWHLVIIGPVVKVDPASLPKRENIHWLGRREYSELPAYTKSFDVCLMPFARNEATEYINPTKALEYMATARPIVSTAVPDVVSNFSRVVAVAHSHAGFLDHCEKALESQDQEAIRRGIQMAEQNTWEAIVQKLEDHVHDALEKSGDHSPRQSRSQIPEPEDVIPAAG